MTPEIFDISFLRFCGLISVNSVHSCQGSKTVFTILIWPFWHPLSLDPKAMQLAVIAKCNTYTIIIRFDTAILCVNPIKENNCPMFRIQNEPKLLDENTPDCAI